MSAIAPVPVVHAEVDANLKQALAQRARANERSEAAEVRVALRRHLEIDASSARHGAAAA